MHSMSILVTVAALLVASSTPQTIDPDTVPIATRDAWCQSQTTSCPLICLQLPGTNGATDSNTCDPTTLAYTCVCDNGQSPNASQYSQTIPYYVCTQSNIDCVNNCGGISSCQAACRDDNPCGAQNPTRVNTSTISTMSATSAGAVSTGAGGTVYSGFGGGAAATTTAGGSSGSSGKSGATAALNIGQAYGMFVVAAGAFAGFAFLL